MLPLCIHVLNVNCLQSIIFSFILQAVYWTSQSAAIFLLLSSVLIGAGADVGHGGEASHLEADDPDFSGIVDFSNAIPGPDGSWCITKTKYVDHMVKDQVKECWHENVTQCHDTYVTEFLPSQEQKCEETFWKSCKIDFKEAPYNYTMKQCHTPLIKECDPPAYGNAPKDAEIVCKTWFESECNTTFVERSAYQDDLPNTWCKKVPRKICAPDNCRMVAGPEQCNKKMMVSTIQKPSEVCDLQPQTHCRLITRLVPHLIQKEVCRWVPKEMCHLALGNPHPVKKPMRLRWCTKNPPKGLKKRPQYKPPRPSYLPPSPTRRSQVSPSPTTSYAVASPAPQAPEYTPSEDFAPPSFSSPTSRPALQFASQRRSQQELPISETATKFRPLPPKNAEIQDLDTKPQNQLLIEDFFVQNSAEDLELLSGSHALHLVSSAEIPRPVEAKPPMDLPKEPKIMEIEKEEYPVVMAVSTTASPIYVGNSPLYRESLKALPQLKVPTKQQPLPASILNPYPVSISDELSGNNFPINGVFAAINADHEPTL